MAKSGINGRLPLCVVFDLDDTLFYEWRFVASGTSFLCGQLTDILSPSNDAKLLNRISTLKRDMTLSPLKGVNHFDILEKWLSQYAPSLSSRISEFVALYRQHIPNLKLQHDRKQLLEFLKQKDIPMAIITDGRSITQRNKYFALKLNNYISADNLLISEEIGDNKLSATAFEIIEQKYPNHRYIYIGDNPYKDFHRAHQRGWLTISVTPHPCAIRHCATGEIQQADFEIKHFIQIKNIINMFGS